LTEVGPLFYFCDVADHCDFGKMFGKINVLAVGEPLIEPGIKGPNPTTASPSTSSTASPSTPSSASPSTPSSASSSTPSTTAKNNIKVIVISTVVVGVIIILVICSAFIVYRRNKQNSSKGNDNRTSNPKLSQKERAIPEIIISSH
jgi:hypothetical protein